VTIGTSLDGSMGEALSVGLASSLCWAGVEVGVSTEVSMTSEDEAGTAGTSELGAGDPEAVLATSGISGGAAELDAISGSGEEVG